MFISDTAIKRPVLTVVAMMAIVVFGMVALLQLDTDEYPEINAPIVVVAIPYPGASPDTVEREVIEPIEEVISGISGVDRMTSSSLDGFGKRGVVDLACSAELFDEIVARPGIHRVRGKHGGLASAGFDLRLQPLEVFARGW